MSTPPTSFRTFIAYVEDLPGVLNRITSLLRRRNYNIVSLTVGRTERPGISRMTIVVEADDDAARSIEANLYKLVNVLWVEDTTRLSTPGRSSTCAMNVRSEGLVLMSRSSPQSGWAGGSCRAGPPRPAPWGRRCPPAPRGSR